MLRQAVLLFVMEWSLNVHTKLESTSQQTHLIGGTGRCLCTTMPYHCGLNSRNVDVATCLIIQGMTIRKSNQYLKCRIDNSIIFWKIKPQCKKFFSQVTIKQKKLSKNVGVGWLAWSPSIYLSNLCP